jgi:hypothetical protein
MRFLILGILILCSCSRTKETSNKAIEQNETREQAELEYDEGETGCVYRITERKPVDVFPFNKSDKIEFVSYELRRDSNDELIRDGKFTVQNIKQRVELMRSQRDSLFSLLYNFKKIRQGDVDLGADCYNGQAIAFLEICFECNGIRMTKDLDFGEFCDEKWCKLQTLFKVNKADYGLIDEMCP